MHTQRTAERRPADEITAEQEAISFRGSSLEDAVAIAEQSLGPRIRVVSANRIRRGGIGGFFASDLGVEVGVVLEDETIDEALERLVAESEVRDRARWQDEREVTATPTTIIAAVPPATEMVDEPSVPKPRKESAIVRQHPTPPPSKRHVELAVAAADQLIERLALAPRVKRLTVKVVVRAGDRREVETEVTWEAVP